MENKNIDLSECVYVWYTTTDCGSYALGYMRYSEYLELLEKPNPDKNTYHWRIR